MKSSNRPSLAHPRLGRQLVLCLAGISATCAAPVPITGAGSYAQNFDSLPNTGTGTTNAWTDDGMIAAWYAQRSGAGSVYVLAGDGSTNTGGIYSFGTVAATERALGSAGSNSSGNHAYGVVLQNTSGNAVTIDSISYTGEQWRNGNNATAHKLTFSYLRSATPITALTPLEVLPVGWTAIPDGDFTGPIATTVAGGLDGNLAANQAAVAVTPNISVANGEYIALRWHDLNDAGNDHGLGIDNLAVSWVIGSNFNPAITLTAAPPAFVENMGATASTGTVTIPAALATDLVVSLASSDATEATVPPTVTIPMGETTGTFLITAVDDYLADGSQGVALTAMAAGFLDGTLVLTVDNDTDAAITITVTPPSFSENAGVVPATVALAEATSVDVVVTLTSNDLTEATVPSTVTIPAGEFSAPFEVTAAQDSDLDGSKSVRIDAVAEAYTPGFVRVTVTDDELAPEPTLNAGGIAFTGYNTDGGDDLAFVALAAIPAGQVIFFTDNEWNGLEFANGGAFIDFNEGSLTWTAPAEGVAAGSIVTLNNLALPSRSASVGMLADGGSFNLSGGSETVYAYQGSAATTATRFLAVIANWAGDSTANTGLSANHIMVLPTDVDIAVYTGSRSNMTSFAGYLDSLVVVENWLSQDGSGDQSIDATAPDMPFDTTSFILGTPALTLTADPATFSESAGASAGLGTVAIPAALPTELVVNLTSGDDTEATVPPTATILIGATTATFAIAAVNDADLDGSQVFNLTATAGGYTAGQTSITVTDDELPVSLSAGAIAFTGYNTDGADDLAFVALVAIPAGEVIFFTDNEWNGLAIGDGGGFNDSNEGSARWVAPEGGVAAGTVVTLNSLSAASRSASVGTVTATANFVLSGSSETVYAYQGTAANAATGFLAVIASWTDDSTANTGLSANHIMVLPTNVDIAAYTGSRSNKTSFAGYLDSLVVVENWLSQDGSGDQSIDATAPDMPFDTTSFVLGSAANYDSWADAHAGGGTPDADFDLDGVPNGVEYFMDSPDGFTVNPAPVAGTISWPMNATATGVTYLVKTSENLTAWETATTGVNVVGSNLVFTLPTTTPSLFVRLEVVVTP